MIRSVESVLAMNPSAILTMMEPLLFLLQVIGDGYSSIRAVIRLASCVVPPYAMAVTALITTVAGASGAGPFG